MRKDAKLEKEVKDTIERFNRRKNRPEINFEAYKLGFWEKLIIATLVIAVIMFLIYAHDVSKKYTPEEKMYYPMQDTKAGPLLHGTRTTIDCFDCSLPSKIIQNKLPAIISPF